MKVPTEYQDQAPLFFHSPVDFLGSEWIEVTRTPKTADFDADIVVMMAALDPAGTLKLTKLVRSDGKECVVGIQFHVGKYMHGMVNPDDNSIIWSLVDWPRRGVPVR